MPSRLRPRPRTALVLLLFAAMLGGCGSSSSGNGIASKSATQIVAAAKAAADGAATVHVSGTVTSERKPLTIDMELVKAKGGRGRIAIAGVSINLVRVGGAVYINGSQAFYRRIAGPAAARLLQGKWLKAPEKSGNFASLASLTDLAKLVDTTLASHGKIARDGTKTVGGQKVVAITDVSQGGSLYVATTGTPFPIEVVKAGGGGGRIIFDRWNKPVTLVAPANAININQLQNGH
ncbi:MAG: hypothetical protein JWL67_509 [Solirubrobacterales bacterium]|jgi:hypothetical protein|nr:hypothetical protein [Solirubrobacterales bacterium]